MPDFRLYASAFQGYTESYVMDLDDVTVDDLDAIDGKILKLLKSRKTNQKFSVGLEVTLSKLKEAGREDVTRNFVSRPMIYLVSAPDKYDFWDSIMEQIAKYTNEGSGFTITKIAAVYVNTSKYTPVGGKGWKDIPKVLLNKKCLVNIQTDESCFELSTLYHIHKPQSHPEFSATYAKYPELGMKKEVTIADMPKMEKLLSRPINVFRWSKGKLELAYKTSRDGDAFNYMLCSRHYMPITDIQRLLRSKTDRKEKCPRCFTNVGKNHVCSESKSIMVFPDQKVKFKNTHKERRSPVCIYADFESILQKTDEVVGNTQLLQKHIPCGLCYYVVGVSKDSKPVVYRGPNCADRFIADLEHLKITPDVNMEESDWEKFYDAKSCHVCKQKFEHENDREIDGNCYEFFGAAHKKCMKGKVQIFFHNLRGYDAHHLIRALEYDCHPIAQSMEKFMAIDQRKFVFADSLQIMGGALDRVAASLKEFPHTWKHTGIKKPGKGFYPYEYMDSFEKFKNTDFPPIEAFDSKLTGKGISPQDYEYAKGVFSKFKNMGEYHDYYMMLDVLLLADAFENFRAMTLKEFGLDCAHYYSAPVLLWDALLKKTGIELDLLDDSEKYGMIKRGKRGGVSMVTKRLAKANNPQMKEYDSRKETSYIFYVDANNLYGGAMMNPMPTGDFEMVDAPADILETPDDAEYGYILEVDLDYPRKLHKLHSDYPLAPEKIKRGSVMKLIPNLWDKKNYVVHYRLLKFYVRHGLVLKKIHKVLRFKQSTWMKDYIWDNTLRRIDSETDAPKNLYKLLNNSVYGKTCENKEKRTSVYICKTDESIAKNTNSPLFACQHILADDCVIVQLKPGRIIMDKPIYVGMTVLEISKLIMFEYYYDRLKPYYGDRVQLCYTDTDSLMLYVKTENIDEDIRKNQDWYDLTSYEKGTFEKIIEFIGLRPKAYSFVTEKSNTKKLKGHSSKEITHEDYRECLLQAKVFHHNQTLLQSRLHSIFTVTQKKVSLSPHDDKRINRGFDTFALGYAGI